MRLVLDLNNLVSGYIGEGPSSFLLEQFRNGGASGFISRAMLENLDLVLRRAKFGRKLLGPPGSVQSIMDELHRILTVVEPAPVVVPMMRDPQDLAIVACAVGANADMLVSGDEDLVSLGKFGDIPIVRAIDAARALGYGARP